MHQLQVAERLLGGEARRPGVVVALQHAVEHVRGVEGAPDGRVGVGAARQQLAHPLGERVRQGRELALGEPLEHRLEVRAEQHLAGEPGVGQHRVVQVVGQAEQERVGRVGADVVGEQGAVDGDGPAVLGVVLGRLDDQPRTARRRRARAGLAAQRLRRSPAPRGPDSGPRRSSTPARAAPPAPGRASPGAGRRPPRRRPVPARRPPRPAQSPPSRSTAASTPARRAPASAAAHSAAATRAGSAPSTSAAQLRTNARSATEPRRAPPGPA